VEKYIATFFPNTIKLQLKGHFVQSNRDALKAKLINNLNIYLMKIPTKKGLAELKYKS
jgi:uncharacterized protein YutD